MTHVSASAVLVSAACMLLLAALPARAEERAFARRDTDHAEAVLAYPQFGHVRLDGALARFAAQELERRARELERESLFGQGKAVRLEGRYTLFRPSPQALSVLFELCATSPRWDAPRRSIASCSYRLPTGDALTLADIFADVPAILKLFARKCPPRLLARLLERHTQEGIDVAWFLRTRLITPGYPMPEGPALAEFSRRGNGTPAMRLLDGVMRATRAEAENYRHILLTPEGVRIQFTAFQADSPEPGAPHVDLNLRELQDGKPDLELWEK